MGLLKLLQIVRSVKPGTWLVVAAILFAAWMLRPERPPSAIEECREIAAALGKTAEGQRISNIAEKAYAACLAKKVGSD